MQRDRAWRRSQRERKIHEVFKWMRDRDWFMWNNPTDPDQRVERLLATAKARHSSPKACSCWGCGNPRTHFGAKSKAEARFDLECREIYTEEQLRINFSKSNRRW